ncbi:MAG: PAS domain S-box protein [Gallionellaceae bacterium]
MNKILHQDCHTFLLQNILEHIPIRVFWKDLDSRYLGCNTLFAKDAGLNHPDELVGKTDFDTGWKNQAELYRTDDKMVMASGIPRLRYEEPSTTPDGRTIWLRTSKVPLFDVNQTVIGILGIYEDITAQKQVETAVRESEETLAKAQSIAHFGSWKLDLLNNRLTWSAEIYRIFEIDPGSFGASYEAFLQTIHPEDRENVNLAYTESLNNKLPYSIEHRLLMKDGRIKHVHEQCETIYDRNGKRQYSIGTVHDITERKKAEHSISSTAKMLRESQQLLEAIVEHIPVMVFVKRASDLRFELFNRAGEQLLGYSRSDLLGKGNYDLWPREQGDWFTAADRKVLASEEVTEIPEEPIKIASGGMRYLHTWKVGLRDEGGEPTHLLGISIDITERKRLEKEIQERQKEMAELQKLQIAAQTAAAIAHEMNQPLLAIASYSEAALMLLTTETPNRDKICKAVDSSRRQALRAGQAIRELLDFLSTNEFTTDAFDLNQEIVGMLDAARSEHELQIHSVLRLEAGLPLVTANRTHIQKVLLNLLHNGIEAMQEADVSMPSITVTVRMLKDKNVAQVTIRDNGPGFRDEDIQRLFQPFFTTKARGIGLGLAISRSLVEANSGQLWADPQEKPGATFHLTLPFAP